MSNKMIYDIKPKPCIYNGRKYRSRLEARWAYCFDKLGWTAQYEPSEINGRNPDFIIKCNSLAYQAKHIIVEVKPSVFISPEYCYNVLCAYESTPAHILILSDFPFEPNKDTGGITIGVGSQFYGSNDWHRSDMGALTMKCFNDFGSEYLSYDGMISGEVERKQFVCSESDYNEWVAIKHLWIESANKTMFLPV